MKIEDLGAEENGNWLKSPIFQRDLYGYKFILRSNPLILKMISDIEVYEWLKLTALN
ncbi:MAG: hypothetical protein Kow0080_22780 [Candidatus Promineifilaceae bacterium]